MRKQKAKKDKRVRIDQRVIRENKRAPQGGRKKIGISQQNGTRA